jgi:hypothetical protein
MNLQNLKDPPDSAAIPVTIMAVAFALLKLLPFYKAYLAYRHKLPPEVADKAPD